MLPSIFFIINILLTFLTDLFYVLDLWLGIFNFFWSLDFFNILLFINFGDFLFFYLFRLSEYDLIANAKMVRRVIRGRAANFKVEKVFIIEINRIKVRCDDAPLVFEVVVSLHENVIYTRLL